MENASVVQQTPNIRKVAKQLANGRREHKDHYRRIQQFVLENYAQHDMNHGNFIAQAPPLPESPEKPTLVATTPQADPVWNMSARVSKQSKHKTNVKLQTVLQVADDIYKFAAHDFDKMDLNEHMEYILTDMKQKGLLSGDVSQMLVTKDLILTAQHRKMLAEKDYDGFIAKQAALNNLPAALEESFKTCKNCGDRFRFEPSHDYLRRVKTWVHHGQCHYHPGAIRCWNDELIQKGMPLKEKFLTHGNVKMSEFPFMIRACYWDCCGAKLVMPTPDVASCGKRRKQQKIPPHAWEIPAENDGIVGCEVVQQHIAAD